MGFNCHQMQSFFLILKVAELGKIITDFRNEKDEV
jgi:hypothetical protein